jgi:hypothetical protein
MTVSIASGLASLSDLEPLHLPVPGLDADLELGSGCVALTDELLEAPAAPRAEVLQHWIQAFDASRESVLIDRFRRFAASLSSGSFVERTDRFRRLCAAKDFDCSPDFPVLLQRF